MAVSLVKGGNISLTKEAPAMTETLVGLGWNPRKTDGEQFDLDALAFMVGEDGKVISEKAFIYFNNKVSSCNSVTHMGDNRDGEGEGDDEQIAVKFPIVPSEVKKIVIGVTIYKAEERKQNFGMVNDAYVRVVNNADNVEIARFDLSEDASTETAMIFGELYRHNDDWKFKAIGQGFAGGLPALVKEFGVNI